MRLTKILTIFSGFASLVLASESRKRDRGDEETSVKKSEKRDRRTIEHAEFALVEGLGSMTLSSTLTGTADDRIANYFDSSIPIFSDNEIYKIIEEAIDFENITIIKLLHKQGRLAPLLDIDHVDALIRSKTPNSIEIFKFIIVNVTEIFETLDLILVQKLPYVIDRDNFEIFKIMWETFRGEAVDTFFLAGILAKTTSSKYERFYDYIIGKYPETENLKNKTFLNVLMYSKIDSIDFMIEKGDVSFESLDLNQKIRVFNLAVLNNRPDIVRNLLVFPDVLTRANTMPKSPILEAVYRDHPEVLDVLLEFIHGHSLRGLVMCAFSLNNIKILEYFKAKGNILDDLLLFTMAITAINGNRLEAFETAIKFGLELSSRNDSGENLLTIAVKAGSFEITQYLLETCRFDPNTPNVCYDPCSCRTTSTAIYYAKSPRFIRLLTKNGADVNAKFIIESHRGAILKSTTALHNAASVKDKVLFEALIEAGADITIPDALGNTIESVEFNLEEINL